MKATDLVKKLEAEIVKNPDVEVFLDCGDNAMREKIFRMIGKVRYSPVRKVILINEGRFV